jgi:phytoene desaturase
MVGGGTHPGSGLPVIFLSSEITTRLLCEEEGVRNPLAGNGARVHVSDAQPVTATA